MKRRKEIIRMRRREEMTRIKEEKKDLNKRREEGLEWKNRRKIRMKEE